MSLINTEIKPFKATAYHNGDNYAPFKKLGVEIYGASTDTHFTHKAWHDTSETIAKVQYPLIGDPTLSLARNFEVLNEEAGLAYRGTFVIDPAGHIKIIEVHDNGIGRDAKELLRKVKWTPGERTLSPSLDLVGKI